MISQSQDADKSSYGKNTDGGKYSKNVDDDKYEKNEKDVDDDDSSIVNQIRYGLDAAQKYEQLKQQRRELSAQEDIHQMNISFPRLPEDNAVTALLTEDEYVDLRFAMQNNASNVTALSVANVRQQLTEYHSLLDQLNSITTKYTALQKTSQDQAAKIRSLEEEVASLKRRGMQSVTNPSNIPRRISVDQPPLSFYQSAIQIPQLSGSGSSGGYPPFLLNQQAAMFSSRRRLPQQEEVSVDSMKASPRKQDQQLTDAGTYDTSSTIQCRSGYSPIRSAKRSISKEDELSQVQDTKRFKSV